MLGARRGLRRLTELDRPPAPAIVPHPDRVSARERLGRARGAAGGPPSGAGVCRGGMAAPVPASARPGRPGGGLAGWCAAPLAGPRRSGGLGASPFGAGAAPGCRSKVIVWHVSQLPPLAALHGTSDAGLCLQAM